MIRKAIPVEHELLTTISFRAKSYWSYPDSYFQIWQKELTITPSYIENNEVFVCEVKQTAIAYYSLVQLAQDLVYSGVRLEAGLWLDHMFVLPEFIGQGVGRLLFHHCKNRLSEHGVDCLNILADPNSLGFYQKMGCIKHGLYPSSIPGRTTPRLTYRPSCASKH